MCSLGTALGFCFNFYQDRIYKRKIGKHGVEARLYGAMLAGPGLAVGCIIFGLTAIQSVHWIGPCVGLTIILSTFMPFTPSLTEVELCLWANTVSVGIHNLSSRIRLPVGMLWIPRLVCSCRHVLPANPARLVLPHVHQPGESLFLWLAGLSRSARR